nr:hypothetical protein GCM10020092_035110 [Actinoplanes digitatis]
MEQHLRVDEHRMLAVRDQVLAVQVDRPDRVQQREQRAGPAVEARTGLEVGERAVRDELGVTVGGAGQGRGGAQVQAGHGPVQPVDQRGEGGVRGEAARLVDHPLAVAEGEQGHRPAALVRVAESGADAGQRARVPAVEQGVDQGAAVGRVPPEQLGPGVGGRRRGLGDQPVQHGIAGEQGAQAVRAGEAGHEVREPARAVVAGQLAGALPGVEVRGEDAAGQADQAGAELLGESVGRRGELGVRQHAAHPVDHPVTGGGDDPARRHGERGRHRRGVRSGPGQAPGDV